MERHTDISESPKFIATPAAVSVVEWCVATQTCLDGIRFGELLHLVRSARLTRISQEDLAEQMGRQRKWISDIETGRTYPRIDDAIQLLHAFDVELVARPIVRIIEDAVDHHASHFGA